MREWKRRCNVSYPGDLNDLAQQSHQTALEKGFWEVNNDVPTKLMLVVTEVAEAMEVYRSTYSVGDRWDENGKPCGFEIELADIIIRVLDLAEHPASRI